MATMVEAEFEWLLKVDIGSTLTQLLQILNECSVSITATSPKQYHLFYSSQNHQDVIKINTTLDGFKITDADINIKLSSKHPIQTIKTCIKESPNNPFCWRLHQIQDAANHLGIAMDLLEASKSGLDNNNYDFDSSDMVLQLINDVMNCLQKSRSSLLIPKKRTIEELQQSQNMQSIRPALPLDFSISFYIQSNNLVCSVYHLLQNSNGPQIRAEYQAEIPLPFLSETLVFLSLGLQMCQQIKDKLMLFPCS